MSRDRKIGVHFLLCALFSIYFFSIACGLVRTANKVITLKTPDASKSLSVFTVRAETPRYNAFFYL